MVDTKHAGYNLHNYVEDSKLSFEQKPFNEVDGLVLTQIANMNFDNLGIDIHSGTGKTIRQVYQEMRIEGTAANDAYNFMTENERRLIEGLAGSPRYQNMVLSNYVNNPVTGGEKPVEGFSEVNSEDAFMEQFAAVTITYTQNGETYNYMSFQATNDTTDGWTEDFAMLSRLSTQAQKDSVDYMNIVGRELEGHIVGGGHSKGGNDFEYGYLFCDEEIRQRIKKGYIYDSPGMPESVLEQTDRYDEFQEIIKGTYICPQDSIIGQLLYENDEPVFIHSVESGFYEHDPYSWEINADSGTFVPDNQTELSILVNQALDIAVGGLSQEQRDALFEFIQYLMYNNGGESLKGLTELFNFDGDDFEKEIIELLLVLLGAWYSMSEEERDRFTESLGIIFSVLKVMLIEYLEIEFKQWVEDEKEQFKQKLIELWKIASDWLEVKNPELKNFLENLYHSFEVNIQKLVIKLKSMSSGYQYATANPQIIINTRELNNYAIRLGSVAARISQLEGRVDSLYRHVGLLDLWNLIQADFLTEFSWHLRSCANYLSDIAKDFSTVDNDLASKIQ